MSSFSTLKALTLLVHAGFSTLKALTLLAHAGFSTLAYTDVSIVHRTLESDMDYCLQDLYRAYAMFLHMYAHRGPQFTISSEGLL